MYKPYWPCTSVVVVGRGGGGSEASKCDIGLYFSFLYGVYLFILDDCLCA